MPDRIRFWWALIAWVALAISVFFLVKHSGIPWRTRYKLAGALLTSAAIVVIALELLQPQWTKAYPKLAKESPKTRPDATPAPRPKQESPVSVPPVPDSLSNTKQSSPSSNNSSSQSPIGPGGGVPSSAGTMDVGTPEVTRGSSASGATIRDFTTTGGGSYEVPMDMPSNWRPEELEFKFSNNIAITVVRGRTFPQALRESGYPLTIESFTDGGFRINDSGRAGIPYKVTWIRGGETSNPSPPIVSDALIQILHDGTELDGQIVFVAKENPKQIRMTGQFKNIGTRATGPQPAAHLHLDKQCSNGSWWPVQSDEPKFPFAFFHGQGIIPTINAKESWG